MRRLPPRPAREPLASFRRPDGDLVEVWATRHTRRSHDRIVDGETYYRPLIAVAGAMVEHSPKRYATESAAVNAVLAMF